jgi:hypothetical protein
MTHTKAVRPTFQSVELDPIDARLEAKAAEKGIPTLISPKIEMATTPVPPEAAIASPSKSANASEITPRSRMKNLKVELPDYLWVELKKKAAEDMVSLRHVILSALRDRGFHIHDADMFEDGRRFR